MFIACFLFSSATLHFKTFRHHVLHQAHVNFTELAGFACLMIHPVPYDMGMAIRFPCGVVARYAVMSFILVDEDLQGCDSPSLMAAVAILPKLVYGRVLFAHHHALTNRRTAIDDFCLAGLFVDDCPLLCLHGTSRFLFYHPGDFIIISGQVLSLHQRGLP